VIWKFCFTELADYVSYIGAKSSSNNTNNNMRLSDQPTIEAVLVA
jgi:hypothetical protein